MSNETMNSLALNAEHLADALTIYRDARENQKQLKAAESNKPVTFKYGGTQIILPVIGGIPMGYKEAIRWLERQWEEEEKEVAINHVINGSPLDAIVAFNRALKDMFGWTNLQDTPGFFGPTPPQVMGIPTGPNNQMEQVPYGRMSVPGIYGYLETAMQFKPVPKFIIGGLTKRKHEAQIAQIVALTNKFLKEKSIYKGKAVKISFEWERTPGMKFNPHDHAPKFMELNPELENTLIFGSEVQAQLNIGLFAPIEQQEACRKYKIPLKRGILLYGKYGTGKTLTATVTASKATSKGWTFIYLSNVMDLKAGLDFAAQYAPAVLFAEDIDRVMTGDRTSSMDTILNTLDGVDTKNGEIITVFTTNHVDKINPAVLRMGRLDTLIEVLPPDAKAAESLIRLYSRGLLKDDLNLDDISKRVAGKIPAFIREVTERAKIAAILRLKGEPIEGHVTEEDLISAAIVMETHDSFLKVKKAKKNAKMLIALDPSVSSDASYTQELFEAQEDDSDDDDDDSEAGISLDN